MFVLATIFFTLLGCILMLVSAVLAGFFVLGLLVFYSYVTDKALTLMERATLGALLIGLLFWAGWLVQFTYHTGMSCLTH